MCKILAVAILLSAGVAHAQTPPKRTFFLDRPGVLESLEQNEPAQYRKVTEILRVSQTTRCGELPELLKTQFEAVGSCGAYVLTSEPPKVHFTFTIGDAVFVTNIFQAGIRGAVIPAHSRGSAHADETHA